MKKTLVMAALGAAAIASTPASAAVVACSAGSGIDLVAFGCTASGNDHLADVEAALADALNVNVNTLNLSLFGKSDDNPGLFNFGPVANPDGQLATDWSVLNGTLIKYITVKGATSFKLYEIAGFGASSGLDLSTLGLVNGGGQRPEISHISFWTVPGVSAIPEPASWGMMILGLGAVGVAMRRRTVAVRFAN